MQCDKNSNLDLKSPQKYIVWLNEFIGGMQLEFNDFTHHLPENRRQSTSYLRYQSVLFWLSKSPRNIMIKRSGKLNNEHRCQYSQQMISNQNPVLQKNHRKQYSFWYQKFKPPLVAIWLSWYHRIKIKISILSNKNFDKI